MRRPAGDHALIQIVEAALADAARRAGDWLVCRPGCTPCCHGVFAISTLDAARLREGLGHLAVADPERATRLRARVRSAVERLAPEFPGNPATGVLGTTADDEARFEHFANDEPCPVLSPDTGTCDLYAHRPMTCRVFGPPAASEDGLGHCELCFQGATTEEVAAAEMYLTFSSLEEELTPGGKQTIIAFALARA